MQCLRLAKQWQEGQLDPGLLGLQKNLKVSSDIAHILISVGQVAGWVDEDLRLPEGVGNRVTFQCQQSVLRSGFPVGPFSSAGLRSHGFDCHIIRHC